MSGARRYLAARVVDNEDLGGDYHRITLEAPELAAVAEAGQFALLGVRSIDEPLVDPLLLRPFSFLGRDAERGTFEVFLRVVGRGTALMASWTAGLRVPCLGPLGKPWPVPSGPALLVAGGVGMPPLLDLAASLAASEAPPPLHVFYGGRDHTHLHLVERFEAAGVEVHLSTDDGSRGERGTNVAALEAYLAGGGAGTVYACGPEGMLAAAAGAARRHGTEAWVSVEAPMACGIGVCRGCAVRVGDGYRMACVDGPVFPAGEVYP